MREIPCQQQKQFDIVYKDEKVGDYIPDLIAYESIVVDTKVIEKITDREVGIGQKRIGQKGSAQCFMISRPQSGTVDG